MTYVIRILNVSSRPANRAWNWVDLRFERAVLKFLLLSPLLSRHCVLFAFAELGSRLPIVVQSVSDPTARYSLLALMRLLGYVRVATFE